MKHKITPFIVTAAILVVALFAAGCGSSTTGGANSPGPYGSAATPNPPKAATEAAEVAVADSALGRILVDGAGRTLYLFEKDTSTASTCDGDCASLWPPFTTTGTPLAGEGASAGEIGTTKRTDGETEVTYSGHPLYYYVGDTKAGDTTGQGLDLFGAEWNVLSPVGRKIDSGA
jgi:predicted lipoprotein with Yx(FWY)xxD motif